MRLRARGYGISPKFPYNSLIRVLLRSYTGAVAPLGYLTALEDLEITRFDRSLLQPIGWEVVCRILQQVSSPLRRLCFTIHRWNAEIDAKADSEDLPSPSLNMEGLPLLDPVLAHPKFCGLEVVRFTIEDTFAIGVISPPTFSCAPVVRDLQKCLPKLYARGIVRVAVTTTAPLHPASMSTLTHILLSLGALMHYTFSYRERFKVLSRGDAWPPGGALQCGAVTTIAHDITRRTPAAASVDLGSTIARAFHLQLNPLHDFSR